MGQALEKSERQFPNDAVDVLIEIKNWRQLLSRYGEGATSEIARDVCANVKVLDGVSMATLTVRDGFINARLTLPFGSENVELAGRQLNRLMRGLADATSGLSSLAVLEASLRSKSCGAISIECDQSDPIRSTVVRIPASEGSEDIRIATGVMDAIAARRLSFVVQPIHATDGGERVLYVESLARMRAKDSGALIFPGSFIPSLERVGMTRRFDVFAVGAMIDLLDENADISIGCNISAQSALEDECWGAIFKTLAARPEIASRLVIEITETAPLVAGKGRRFVNRLRGLGCRIAIDDFGTGFGVQTGIEIGAPDIIKLDGSFVKAARTGELGRTRLGGMASLASDLADCVIVEGIETAADLEMVRELGISWAQGYFFGYPLAYKKATVMLSASVFDSLDEILPAGKF